MNSKVIHYEFRHQSNFHNIFEGFKYNTELYSIVLPFLKDMEEESIIEKRFTATLKSFVSTSGFTEVTHQGVTGVKENEQHRYANWKGNNGSYSRIKEFGEYVPPELLMTVFIPDFNVCVEYEIRDVLLKALNWNKITNQRLQKLNQNAGVDTGVILMNVNNYFELMPAMENIKL